MEKSLTQSPFSVAVVEPHFNQQSKLFAYILISVLVGLILVIEDFTEEGAQAFSVLLEFTLFVPILITCLHFVGKWFSQHRQWFRKKQFLASWKYAELTFMVVWGLLCSLFLLGVMGVLHYSLPFEPDEDTFFNATWTAWVTNLIFLSIAIAVETFWEMLDKRASLELQNERLTRSHEKAKYRALINQVNPHFLFNSLNVLSVLVYKSPREAEKFIEELSSIYRYILQLNESYLVPLEREMDFIQSYLFLQKIRYQKNLTFETNIEWEAYKQLLPPLTLELLVENAIKHNIIAEQQPLHLKLYTDGEDLVLENNLQKRIETKTTGTKIGLVNLREKFLILDCPPPSFYVANGKFIARIPLIKPEL